MAAVNRPDLTLDVASVIGGYLVDPTARAETRAWLRGLLECFESPSQNSSYNFSLAGYEIGELAATLGTKVVAEYDEHPDTFDRDKDRATSLTSLLLFQVIPAIGGEDDISDSGLLRSTHPAAAAAKSFLTKLDEKIRDLSREAYELLRAGGVNQKSKRNDLEVKVKELRTFLDQNKPKDRHLVGGGPELLSGGSAISKTSNVR